MDKYLNKSYLVSGGYSITVIKYRQYNDVDIQFEDGYIKTVSMKEVLSGQIKNPNYPSVCNKGFIGFGDFYPTKDGITTKCYSTWSRMFTRCYNEKYHIKRPTYRDVTVCEEWYNFQNFAKWFETNYIEGFPLDKDILVKGNKIYSPETCCFVPSEINSLVIKSNSKRGECPIGVNKKGNKFQARVKIGKRESLDLGLFNTKEEAFQVYKKAKEDYIKKVAKKWKHLITPQTYQALINYEVEITD